MGMAWQQINDYLVHRLGKKVNDKRLLALIGKFLRAGVQLPDGNLQPTSEGVPQGSPFSPLLANVLLDELDKELERRGHRFARYADDFIIMVRSRWAASRVMKSITRFPEERLKLVVNVEKSRCAKLIHCTFIPPSSGSAAWLRQFESASRRAGQSGLFLEPRQSKVEREVVAGL